MLFLTLFLLIPCLLATVNYIDFRQDYLNSGYAQTYFLTFSLSNPLDKTHYMKLDFPIPLDTTTSFSATWNTDVLAYTYDSFTVNTYLQVTMTRSNLLEDASLYRYFIKFLDSSGNAAALSANTPYLLRVVSSTAYTAGSTGPVDIVGVYITSGNQENNIILDSNPTFSPLYFTTHSVGTLTAVSASPSTITAGSNPTTTVSFTVGTAISANAKVILMLSSSNFKFLSSTCSLAQTVATTDCFIENSQKLIFQIAGGLTTGSKSFSVIVQAPLQGTVTTSLTIYSVQDFYSDIQQTATLATAFTAATLAAGTTTSYTAKFAWGYSTDTTVAGSIPPCIKPYYYASDIVYNTFSFSFTVATTLPTAPSYKLSLNLAGATAILENSIKNNFAASSGQVICRAGTQQVTCTPLSIPTIGTTYTISVKVAFTSSTLSSNFGIIQLFAFDTTSNDYLPNSIIASNRATFTTFTSFAANLANKQVSGQSPITSWPPSQSVNSAYPGVKVGNVGSFLFNVNTQWTDFNSFPNIVGGDTSTGGLEIFTNPNAFSINNPACSSSSASTVSTCGSVLTTTLSVNAIRFRIGFGNYLTDTTQANNKNSFNGNVPFTFTYTTYPVVSTASYLADDYVLDLFFASISKNFAGGTYTTSPYSCYLMNGYVVASPNDALTSMKVYISNFWTGSGTNYMTGNEFPAFIQITGTLASSDFVSGNNDRLSIFFTNLSPFPDEDYTTSNTVACSASQAVTCYYYPGTSSYVGDYNYYNRIDIVSTLSTTALKIIIPVATTAAQVTIAAVVGVSKPDTTYPAKVSLGQLRNALQFSFTFSTTQTEFYQVGNANLNNENYYLDPTNHKTGEVSTGTIYASHYEIAASDFNPNTGTSQSSLYTWTTKYNFYSSASTPTATFMGSGQCLFFTYYYSPDTTYPRRYGVTCPVNSDLAMPASPEPSISIPNFLFPSVEGINMPESFGSLCTNTGLLTQFIRDIRTGVLSPNYVPTATFQEVIYQNEKASIGTVAFTTTNVLPQNSILKLTTSTTPLQFSVKEGYYCALFETSVPNLQSTIIPTNCYQSFEDYALIFKINNSAAWTATTYYLKIYEINVTTFIEISSQDFNFSSYTAQNSLIDYTVTSHSTVSPVNFLSQTRSSDLVIESYSVLSDMALTKTVIEMTVATSSIKPLTRFDQLVFQFWTAPENLDETFAFDVMDYGSTTTTILKSCRLELPYISCTPYYDMLTAQKFTIRLRSFRNPSESSQLLYYMWDLEGNFVFNSTSSTPITYPVNFTTPTGFTEFSLEKRFNYITMYPEFIFTVVPTFKLTLTSAIVIRFPSAYSAADDTQPLLCVIDALEINCFFSGPQEVTITDFPLDQAAGEQFKLSLLGLRQPMISEPYNISFQITTKNNYSSVLAYQEIPDIPPGATSTLSSIQASTIYQASSTPYSLESPDLTISFTVAPGVAGSLSSTRAIVLDFPNVYGLAYHNTSVGYTLRSGGITLDTQTVIMRSFRLEITVPSGVSFAKNTLYTMTLTGIPNPFFETYNHPLILISVTDINRYGIEFQGQRYFLNVEAPVHYIFNPNKHNLEFYQISGSTSTAMTYLAPFQVYAGLPSLQFDIQVVDGARFDRMIIMAPGTLNAVEFTSTPSVLNISSGLVTYTFSLTFPLDAAPGFYGIKFANVETDPSTDLTTTYYSAIPPLLIQLISQKNPITLPTFVSNTLNLPSGGYSFPITFDLSRIKPPNSLTIVANIPPTSDFNIQFVGYTEITLTADSPVGSFTLVHTGGGTPGASQTTISFYLDGPDKDLYTIDQTPIIVQLVSLGSTAPVLTASVPGATITTTGFTISVTADQISQVYYQIYGYYGTPNVYWEISPITTPVADKDYVGQMVETRQYYVNDEYGRKDEYYGVWNYQTASVATTFTFDGLRGGVSHTLKVWAINLKGEASTMYSTTFTTLDNSGRKSSVSLTFNEVLENRQINKISCWLAVRYRLPFDNVKDFLGYSCNDNRTRTDYLIDNILSSQYRIFQQRNTASGPYTYTFYLYPLAFLSYDDSYTNLVADAASLMLTDLNTFITNWVFPTYPTLSVVSTPTVITTTSVDFSSTDFTVNRSNSSLTMSNLALNQKGYIWVYALRKSPDTSNFSTLFVPTKGEFKYYLNSRLNDENYVAMRYYDTSAPVDIVFNGLNPENDYILHYFAQNDDSGNQNLTSYLKSQYVVTNSDQMMTLPTLLISLLVLVTLLF